VSGGTALSILKPALGGGEWSTSRSDRFILWREGWVGFGAGLDAVAKTKVSFITLAGNPTPVV
jgi:hypothetical protein